jgi:hypothetical protein
MASASAIPAVRTLRRVPPEVGYAVLGVLAAVLSCAAAARVSLPVSTDLGLGAVLPPAYWLGVVSLNVLFVTALRRGGRAWVSVLLLCCLVVTLYGAAAFASPTPRAEVAWRHIGIADALMRSGHIDPGFDAYFNWPGFFALLAVVTKATGLPPVDVALWAPVVNSLLWLGALALVIRQLTADRRRLWLTLWLFCLGNWIDQDYLSPQAFSYFLHLCVLALLLKYLGAQPAGRPSWRPAQLLAWWRTRAPTEPSSSRRLAALLVAVFLSAVITASHQLTPFMLLVSATALVAAGRCWSSRFPLLLAVLLVIWLVYPASSYLAGHPLLDGSRVAGATAANLDNRLHGTPGHVDVVHLRIALTGVIWLLAAVGVVLARRSRTLDLRPLVLAIAPFVLLPTQSYGGEMLMRVTLFALPFTAFFAAGALLSGGWVHARWRAAGVAIVCTGLAVMMVTARFGNARFDMFTAAELEATAKMYEIAPAGALLIASAHPTPWRYREYEDHRSRTIEDICGQAPDPEGCSALVMAAAKRNGVLLMTRSGEAALVMQGAMTADGFDRLEQQIRHQSGAVLMYQNTDARLYRIGPAGPEGS